MLCLAMLAAIVGVALAEEKWMTDHDQPINFVCPKNKAISRIKTDWWGYTKDRKYIFGCTGEGLQQGCCSISQFLNAVKLPLNYTCPGNSVLTGIHSLHYNWEGEDRRFKFVCCEYKDRVPKDCSHWNTFLHEHYDVDAVDLFGKGYVFKGATSVYKDNDRRWRYTLCHI